jgi:hypothetical protein
MFATNDEKRVKMLKFQEHQNLQIYEDQVIMDLHDDDEEQEITLTERSFGRGSKIAVGAVYAYLLSKASDLKSQVSLAKQAKDTDVKLDHLANAIQILSTRITASSALSYAAAKALKLK